MPSVEPQCSVLDGVLAIRKDAGWTSHDVVSKLRRILGGAKVGHGGTLDPAATGVLPVLIGRGTRLAEYLVDWQKDYRAVLRLGETTDTQDATGTILTRHPTDGVTEWAIHEAVKRFHGPIRQIPPMYSAVKVHGVPLYKSARAGRTVDRDARTVQIHAIDILAIQGRDVTLRVLCSKGTYVRTLCEDIGMGLGVGGHLLSLERLRVGPLTLEKSMTIDEATTCHALGRLTERLLSLDEALRDFPSVRVDPETAGRVRHGVPIPLNRFPWSGSGGEPCDRPRGRVRIHDSGGRLLAIGRFPGEPSAAIAIEKVFIGSD